MLVSRIEEFIQNQNEQFPLTEAFKNGNRFYSDFIEMIKMFEDNLSDKEQDNIYNKIENHYSINDIEKYFQCNCELIVLYYILRNYNSEFKYEPMYNGHFNPECSFTHNNITINIEVKTPDYAYRNEQENKGKILLSLPDRSVPLTPTEKGEKSVIDKFNESNHNVEIIKSMDNKLKDYLEHSQKKFPNGDNYFNILAIALETPENLDEWYTYILGNNGVFTDSSYVNSNYDNVDAILLGTPIAKLKTWKNNPNVNVWYLEEAYNLIINDTRKEGTKKERHYSDNVIDIFGSFTRGFVNYLNEFDKQQNADLIAFKDVVSLADLFAFKDIELSANFFAFHHDELHIVSNYIYRKDIMMIKNKK